MGKEQTKVEYYLGKVQKFCRIALVLILVAVAIFALLLAGTHFFVVKPLAKKLASDGSELRMFKSAAPLLCSYDDLVKHEDDIDELTNLGEQIAEKRAQCGRSLPAVVKCIADIEEEMDNPSSYIEVYQRVSRLYDAYSNVKAVLYKAHRRVKAIQTYSEESENLKKSMLGFTGYLQGIDAIDVLAGRDQIERNLEKRGNKIGENLGKWLDALMKKYPEVGVLVISYNIVGGLFFVDLLSESEVASVVYQDQDICLEKRKEKLL